MATVVDVLLGSASFVASAFASSLRRLQVLCYVHPAELKAIALASAVDGVATEQLCWWRLIVV